MSAAFGTYQIQTHQNERLSLSRGLRHFHKISGDYVSPEIYGKFRRSQPGKLVLNVDLEVNVFRCQLCQTVVPAGTRTSKIVLTTRSKTYDERGRQPSERGGFRGRGRRITPKSNFDKGGEGREIVREAAVCPACAAEHNQKIEREQSLEEERKVAGLAATTSVESDSGSEVREQTDSADSDD